MTTLKAALPDWFGQKYFTGCLKYKNGMGLTWELINPRNFDFLCHPNAEAAYYAQLYLLSNLKLKKSPKHGVKIL